MTEGDHLDRRRSAVPGELVERQIDSAERLHSTAVLTGRVVGVLLLAGAVFGLVLAFQATQVRLCSGGFACRTVQQHNDVLAGISVIVSCVVAGLFTALAVTWAKAFAVGCELAAAQAT